MRCPCHASADPGTYRGAQADDRGTQHVACAGCVRRGFACTFASGQTGRLAISLAGRLGGAVAECCCCRGARCRDQSEGHLS